jgi:hypothetical protein
VKTLGNILGAVASVIRYAPFGPVGLVVAAAGVLGLQALANATPAIRPETTESSRKSPVPARKRYYGKGRLFGDWLLYSYKSDGTPVDVWAFQDGQMHAVTQVYLNDDKVTIVGGVVQALGDKRYQDGRLLAGYNLGLPTETAFAAVVSALPGIWTSDHRGDGIVTGYLIKQLTKTEKFLETYPNGDDIQMSIAGEWSLVFDPRDEAQDANDSTTWRYDSATPGDPNPGENPVAAFLHYQLTQRGVDFDTQILPQIDKWIAALDDCDTAQALSAGGTEPRYRLSLGYNANEAPASINAAFLAAFDGWFCENTRGELIIYSGRYYEPTKSLGPDQIVDYSLQRHVEAENAVNEVTITYVSAEHEYTTPDAQAWRDQAAIDASGREPVTVPLQAQIPSPTQGRRLAKRKMIRANAPHRGTITTTYGGRDIIGERFIWLRIEEAGTVFYDGPAEIVSSPERDMQTGGVRFDWVAATPDIDDWDPATEDGAGTPVGEIPTIDPLDPPVITDLETIEVSGSSRLKVTIASEDREDLTWFLRWRLSAESIWSGALEFRDIPAGTSVEIVTDIVPVGELIEIQASYGTGDGRHSDWSDTAIFYSGDVTADLTLITADSVLYTADEG